MEDQFIPQNRIRQIFFLAIIVLCTVMLAMELYSFLPALLGAVTLYVITRKWMIYMTETRNWRPAAAASILMILTFLIILIPIGVLVQMLSSKISYAILHSEELVAALEVLVANLEERLGIEITSAENLNKLSGFIAQIAPKIVGATFDTLVTIFFMYFILFFMLINARTMERALFAYITLKDENIQKMGTEMQS